MKVEYINPFIAAVEEFCGTMLGFTPVRGKLRVSQSAIYDSDDLDLDMGEQIGKHNDITALIGLTGRARGTVAISFPGKTALMMARAMLGTDKIFKIDNIVVDAVAEMVNIVAGSAKTKLTGDGDPIGISLPTVVRGRNFEISYPTGSVWLQIPFTSELGFFSVQVSFEAIE